MRQNKNTWFYISGSGLDRTNDFQKFGGSGLDQIQFYRIKTGLGLKNFTVCSSLPQRLLLLPKWKIDSASGSGFSQIFDSGSRSGSERKTQNPAGVDSGTPDLVPSLECSTYWQYKNHSKENTDTIICDILNHSQENFVIEIKPITWSNFFQKWISKSNPDPKKSQVSCMISNPVHAHTSTGYTCVHAVYIAYMYCNANTLCKHVRIYITLGPYFT